RDSAQCYLHSFPTRRSSDLLSVLGPWVDRLRLPFLGQSKPAGTGAWHSMALWVMRRPVVVLIPALALLLLAGAPFLQLRLANGEDRKSTRLNSSHLVISYAV